MAIRFFFSMSDNNSVSDYPSDLEFVEEAIDPYPQYTIDSGFESNDGYLTDINEVAIPEPRRRITRNIRFLRKLLRRFRNDRND